MGDTSAAVWSVVAALLSAVAALFSAVCSFLMYCVQRRNLLESVRPELILSDWTRAEEGEGDSKCDVIRFKTIRNVGRGPALSVLVGHDIRAIDLMAGTELPYFVRGGGLVPFIASGESAEEVNGQITISWNRVQPEDGFLLLDIVVRIVCLDCRGNYHEAFYRISVTPMGQESLMGSDIRDVVEYGIRTTSARPMWLRKLQTRVPGACRSAAREAKRKVKRGVAWVRVGAKGKVKKGVAWARARAKAGLVRFKSKDAEGR